MCIRDSYDVAFAGLTISTIPPGLDQVLVSSLERSRSPELKAAFVPTVNDGLLPRRIIMEGLFTDADRQALRACGAALAPDTIARQFQEDYLCYIALTRSSGKPVSYTHLLLGRIAYTGNGRIAIKLSQPLFIGDMLEVWVSVGSRETITVKEIYRDNLPCDSAQPGDTVSVVGNGGREGDRVFKIFDAPLMEAARASFNDFITKPLHFQVTAKLGQPLRIRAFDDDGYQAEYVSEYIVSAANTSISDMTSVRVQLGRLGGTGYSLGERCV